MLRTTIWLLLALCAFREGEFGDATFLGFNCAFIDVNSLGASMHAATEPQDWLLVVALVALQGFLILALIRLRGATNDPSPTPLNLLSS